ncbi:Uncharacterized protein NEOC65_001214 [Neochlamydia sp. AcF65]|nr:Uncharacterized protein [Neochlamydia sp. AcF65]
MKQNASLEKSPIKIVCSQKKSLIKIVCSQRNHIFVSLIAYCKLEFLKIKTLLDHFALKYKLIFKANQMAYQKLQNLQGNSMSV